ncbi:MAG: hypothetical protein AB2813_12925 [Candidatus Sedimenticola endophacoides]
MSQQGYTRVQERDEGVLEVVQDRLRLGPERRDRLLEALETALDKGRGRVTVYPLNDRREPLEPLRFSADLHCPDCDIHYKDPLPNHFSFNSPLGACDHCRGFGRVMGVDWDLVIPDPSKSLGGGAVRPFQGGRSRECQEDLLRFAARRGIPTDRPWRELEETTRRWVIEGEEEWNGHQWYGVRRFFEFLESKSYKMHIRVLLSKYRAYNPCPAQVCRL